MSEDTPVKSNAVVDKSAANVAEDTWVPRDKMELTVALQNLAASVEDKQIPKLYASFMQAIKLAQEDKGDETMTTKKKIVTEEQLRLEIRKLIHEAVSDLETDASAKGSKKPRQQSLNADKENLVKIAAELGLKVSGAQRLVDWTLAKLQWLTSAFPGNELDLLILQFANDYVEDLVETGELTPEEVQLIRDNVDMIKDSPDFLEYLNYEIKQLPGYKAGLYKYLGKDPKTGKNLPK